MSMTPVFFPVPAPGPVAGPASPGGGDAAATFSALVAQVLGQATATAGVGAGTTPAAGDQAPGSTVDGEDEAADAGGEASATVLPLMPPTPQLVAIPAPLSMGPATAPTTPGDEVGMVGVSRPSTPLPRSLATAPVAAAAALAALAPVAGLGRTTEAATSAPVPAAASTAPEPVPATAPVLTLLTDSAAAAGTAPTTATAAVSPEAPATVAVTRQVFPEVTSLARSGNGTHRVTLQLEPEALGEVRVVLTVRDGEVHVRLAAGDEAQRALLEGAPELRRLLELTGASDTRIVVRDLPSGAAPQSTLPTAGHGSGDGATRQDAGQAGPGGERSHDQHAGTRGGSTARDGRNDGAAPPRSVDEVTHARSAGVDVTV